MPEPVRRSALRRARSVGLRLLLGVLAAVLLAEVGLRFVLFAEAFDGTRVAARLRRPDLYAEHQLEDLHWLLRDRFQAEALRRGPRSFDEVVGWTSGVVEPRTYLHAERGLVGGRRPVLLYGDSYAQCVTEANDCFGPLLERTELARGHYLLNYGVGGFGLDQVLLLLRSSIDLYRADDPIVVVGIFVEDDLDRCALSFRQWPKPRMRLRDGELVLERETALNYSEYVAQSSPSAASYLWRLVARSGPVPPATGRAMLGLDDDELEKRRVAAAILAALLDELESRGLDHMVALFYDTPGVEDPLALEWRVPLLRDELERRGTPFVDVGDALRERVARTGEPVSSFYGTELGAAGHYNDLGNEMAFAAIADGLARFTGTPPAEPFPSPRDIANTVLPSTSSFASYEFMNNSRFTELEDCARLRLGVGRGGATEIHYDLRGRVHSFRARARFVPQDEPTTGSVGLSILADGETLFERTLLRSDAPLDIAVPLTGRSSLVLRADDANDGPVGDRIVLSAPRFD